MTTCLPGCCKGHCGGAVDIFGCECEGHAPGCLNTPPKSIVEVFDRVAAGTMTAARGVDRLLELQRRAGRG